MVSANTEVSDTFDLFAYITRTNNAKDSSTLFSLLLEAMEAVGFDCLNFYSFSGSFRNEHQDSVSCSHNYPLEYSAESLGALYEAGDPVLKSAHVVNGLCRWDELQSVAPVSVKKQKLLDARLKAGLHDGVSIPLRAAYGAFANLELASSMPGVTRSQQSLSMANLLAVQFFKCFASMNYRPVPSDNVRLTNMEREVLILLSKGLTKKGASSELGVSSYAVDFHCRNILKKYHTNKIIVAIVDAMQSGQLYFDVISNKRVAT